MKLVIQTQYRENYGAHDWDGKHACPQYWKNKGGDTFFIDVSIEQAQDPAFYEAVDACIEHDSDYIHEYVINHELVDDADFNPDEFVEQWEVPVWASFSDGHLVCRTEVRSYGDDRVTGERTWLQDANGKREVTLREFGKMA